MDGGYGEETRKRETDDNAVILEINIQNRREDEKQSSRRFFQKSLTGIKLYSTIKTDSNPDEEHCVQ